MKHKCRFCDKQIDSIEIRCKNCDNAYHDGYADHKETQKLELFFIMNKIKTLIGKDK